VISQKFPIMIGLLLAHCFLWYTSFCLFPDICCELSQVFGRESCTCSGLVECINHELFLYKNQGSQENPLENIRHCLCNSFSKYFSKKKLLFKVPFGCVDLLNLVWESNEYLLFSLILSDINNCLFSMLLSILICLTSLCFVQVTLLHTVSSRCCWCQTDQTR
jgi:hypothetical protein